MGFANRSPTLAVSNTKTFPEDSLHFPAPSEITSIFMAFEYLDPYAVPDLTSAVVTVDAIARFDSLQPGIRSAAAIPD